MRPGDVLEMKLGSCRSQIVLPVALKLWNQPTENKFTYFRALGIIAFLMPKQWDEHDGSERNRENVLHDYESCLINALNTTREQ
jgi:hypothetical protein